MPLPSDAISGLASMPDRLEALYRSVPDRYARWEPASWDGCPGETFAALGQLCHVRDLEVDGYQERFRRVLAEERPFLASIDGYAVARERRYEQADAAEVLASFRAARAQTVATLSAVSDAQLRRRGEFEGYGPVTLEGLVRFLCSHDEQHLACLHWLLGKALSSSQD